MFHTLYCKQLKKCLTDFILHHIHHWWHTPELPKSTHKKLAQNTAKQRKHMSGVWRKTLSCDNHWDWLWFPTQKFNKLNHSSGHCVATVAFCLHVTGRRLWCWNSRQLAPRAMKGLRHRYSAKIWYEWCCKWPTPEESRARKTGVNPSLVFFSCYTDSRQALVELLLRNSSKHP